jgi:uncharacterized protein YecE (DUF72 family)
MKKWWIGCSGFHYKEWKDRFYPEGLPQRKWFEYYCEYFNTVELNVTFYRFPRVADLRRWYEKSPEGFRFTVKAPRLITHYKRFHDVKRLVHDFYDAISNGLRDKLGSVLFQLHPAIHYGEPELKRIVENLDPSFVNVVEFRHESWWRPKVRQVLQEAGIVFCGISYPTLPDTVEKTAPSMYYRFHGVPKLYLSSYSNKVLTHVAEEIKRRKGVEEVYIYFNNDIDVAAVRNARTLQKIV